LIIIAAVGLFETQCAWNNYEKNYNQHFAIAKVDVDKVISINKLNSIIQTQTKLTDEIKSYCEVNPLIKWQSFIAQYLGKINDCNRQKTELGQLLTDLSKVTGYLESEQKLSAIISGASDKTNTDNQAGKLSGIEAYWRQAVADVSKLPDTEQFKAIKTLAGTDLASIADAWKQLSSANDAKNKQQFEDAHSNLNQAYTSLAVVGDNGKVEADKLITVLGADYGKI
jgi:hypothetical protein